jgi:hypothetical protein
MYYKAKLYPFPLHFTPYPLHFTPYLPPSLHPTPFTSPPSLHLHSLHLPFPSLRITWNADALTPCSG